MSSTKQFQDLAERMRNADITPVETHRVKNVFLLLACSLSCVEGWAAISVPLTIQEALYQGSVPGVARSNEPFCQGVPLADSAAITSVNVLGLTGATAGQFRILGRWPDGNAKWVEVCGILPSLNAGSTAIVTLTDAGTGNFGGSNLATDNGATITVATGAATFTIKKAHFNVVDQAVVSGTTVLATGSSQGLVITGPPATAPFPGNVTCTAGSCTVAYSSSNDPNSTCTIEKNGPVEAVLNCSGNHVDGSGNIYLHFTVREYFHLGKTSVKVTSILRNADYGASGTFASAFKGHQGYELRLKPNISGTLNYTFGNHTATPSTGTLNSSGGTDSAYLYQGESQFMISRDWCGYLCVPYTTDTGYSVVKNGTTVISGTDTQYPQGWADISNSNGVGVEIGVYQLAAYWPKSLEFNGGGTDVRIGIWARENSQPYYQSWPQHSTHDLYLNFHSSALPSPANSFLGFQHYLLARAPYSYYNNAQVFPYPLNDPTVEDSYYTNAVTTATPSTLSTNMGCCILDASPNNQNGAFALEATRFFAWGNGGGSNQTEFRWSFLMNFLNRGFTGRYLSSAQFYRYQTDSAYPRADGFTWNSHQADIDGFGYPANIVSQNSSLAISQDWADQEHGHTYGVEDYYYLSGDETIHDAISDQLVNHYTNQTNYSYPNGGGYGSFGGHVTTNGTAVAWVDGPNFSAASMVGQAMLLNGSPYVIASVTSATSLVLATSAGTNVATPYIIAGGVFNARSIGVQLLGMARLSKFLSETGDTTDAATTLQIGKNLYTMQVAPPLCLSGYPIGCSNGPINPPSGQWLTEGTSRTRGLPYTTQSGGTDWCGINYTAYRATSAFQSSIEQQGIMEFRAVAGSSWSEYWNSLDLAYGMSRAILSELYVNDGTGNWLNNGFRYYEAIDGDNNCTAPGEQGTPDSRFLPQPQQTVSETFLVKYAVDGDISWQTDFNMNLQKLMGALGMTTSDFGDYQIAAVINAINSYSGNTLQSQTITRFTDNGGGSYTIGWTTPPGTTLLRVKYGSLPIVDLIGFNSGTNTFIGNPATTMNWFAAANASGIPAPVAGAQTMTISTGITGLSASNFSVKAMAPATGSGPGTGTGPAAILQLISGNGQSGTGGQSLSNPFTVKVSDANGNPVSGVTVSFTITAGAGTLSVSQATTSSQGLASCTLTLGALAGTNTVVAAAGTLVGSPITFSATATGAAVGPAAVLLYVSGTGQSGPVAKPLTNPFVVEVTDAKGNPVSGIGVTFSIIAGGGSLTAGQVTTNSQGMASTLLTLGPAAGTNTVVASYGTLIGSPVTFSAIGTAGSAGASVTWNDQAQTSGWPGYGGYFTILFDPVAQQTILYSVLNGSESIYSTDLFFYNSTNNIWTHLGGTGSMVDNCVPDGPTWPGNRHPGWQMAIDTKRNFYWIAGGVCQGANLNDLYYLQLTSNPLNDTWHKVATPAHLPPIIDGAMAYDPDDDVLFLFGYDGGPSTNNNWVYCRTAENPTPGVPTAKQAGAGCTNPDDWNEIQPIGGVQPQGIAYPGMVYDTVTKKMIQFGGNSGSLIIAYNQTWAYDVPSKTWTQKALATIPPPIEVGLITAQPALAYNSATNKVLFHQASNTGAPADWQYDPVADTWTELSSSGGGPAIDTMMAYDSAKNVLVTFSRSGPGVADIWQGTLSSAGVSFSRCDLNHDGLINILDVQTAINQAIGLSTCGNGDVNSDGLCNIVDVQIVINASLGGSCQ
jgi:YetA-like protein/Bacterial Ig-like domain (group 1)